MTRRAAVTLGALLITVVAGARFVASGLLAGTGRLDGPPEWFKEEYPPLVGLLVRGIPIEHIDQRQYGVVSFLLVDPVIRIVGDDPRALAVYLGILAPVALAGSIALLLRRFGRGLPLAARLLVVAAWLAALPVIYDVATRSIDVEQTLFLSAALFLFTAPGRARLLAGVPLAAGALTKILPGYLLLYLVVRDPRAGAIGIAAALALLLSGHALYGPLIGLEYPLAIAAATAGVSDQWSYHQENNSLRGLLFKAAAGFRLDGAAVRATDASGALSVIVLAAALAITVHLVIVARAGGEGRFRRTAEFGLASAAMLLVSPHTAIEYTAMILPSVTGLLLLLLGSPAFRSREIVAPLAIGTALVGVFLPVAFLPRLLPLDALVAWSGNRDAAFLASPFGAYAYFGFSGLGVIALWVAFSLALRRSEPRSR